MFLTQSRKRKGQLERLVEKQLLKIIDDYEIKCLLKTEFTALLNECRKKRVVKDKIGASDVRGIRKKRC